MKKQKAGQIPRPYQRAEKAMEHESNSNTNHSQSSWDHTQEPGKETNYRLEEKVKPYRPQTY